MPLDKWPPSLTVDIEPVLNLFTGENFYSSADAAIREAVLNAIDAISRRKEIDSDAWHVLTQCEGRGMGLSKGLLSQEARPLRYCLLPVVLSTGTTGTCVSWTSQEVPVCSDSCSVL